MGVTQKDIAKRLNISQSLVARVLGNSEDVWVSAENRRRIHTTARELGYQPNSAARMLRTGKAYAVSCCYVNSEFSAGDYGPVIEACAEELGRMDYELKVKVYSDHNRLIGGLQHLASARSSDAVILWGEEADVEEQGELLESLGIPFVVKGRHEERHPDWPQVDFDHEGMMASAVDFCYQMGRRRIAYVGHDNEFAYSNKLRKGFEDAFESRTGRPLHAECRLLVSEDARTPMQVKAIVEKWCSLPESERPDAMVLGFGSYVAQELEFALRAQGITIGDSEGKIMMVGIDYSRGELVYGRGWVFPSTRSDTLAQALVSNLLIPILKGDPPTEPVCRILPKLVRMPPPLIGNDYHE